MRILRLLCIFSLLLVGMLAIFSPGVVLSQEEQQQEEEQPIPEELIVTPKYPKVEINSGETAVFDVDLALIGEIGSAAKQFDLLATAPTDWTVSINPSYPADKKIASIQLTPGYGTPEKIQVKATPAYWLQPEPGEYLITLEVTSDTMKQTVEMKAVITAKYSLSLAPSGQLYNTKATAGKDNYFSIMVSNDGSAPIGAINLSADKPENWTISFSTDKVDALPANQSKTIDVNIKPPSKAIAGDYVITLQASGNKASAGALEIRVTVETPTIWGWVGVLIVVGVMVGLVFTFRHFSRR